jgi:hypothetical protein
MSLYVSPKTDIELISRTEQIIKQYKSLENELGDKYYDVTLYLNCLLSLVVLPRHTKLNKLPNSPVPESIKNTIKEVIDKANKNINFNQYILGLRNGLVHFGESDSLKFNDDGAKITSVEIKGSINKHATKIIFEFDLSNGNLLEQAIEEILKFTGYKNNV